MGLEQHGIGDQITHSTMLTQESWGMSMTCHPCNDSWTLTTQAKTSITTDFQQSSGQAS